MKVGLLLSFLSGAVALSYEILWFRAYSFASGTAADTFGYLLGGYLAGLALGSWAVRDRCREGEDRAKQTRFVFRAVIVANAASFLVVPVLARLVAEGIEWKQTIPLVGVAATGLGTLFPLVSHLYVPPDARTGARVSYLYLSNILGSTGGTLVTGFVMMDELTIGGLAVILVLLGSIPSAVIVVTETPDTRLKLRGASLLAASVITLAVASDPLYDGIYERLQEKGNYKAGFRFKHVIETRSGVVTVTPELRIYGGGVYDGGFNVRLEDDFNSVWRAYVVGALHPDPRDVLVIGLGSGSWATVLSNHPAVERVTIVEINPGYLEVIPKYRIVAGILNHPKVTIHIDDARRWLVRNQAARFDLVVANATFNWRSSASNLLSVEFLDLIRSRLKPGGMHAYNTTGSSRVQRTGLVVFPRGLLVHNILVVSDEPIKFERRRWEDLMYSYRLQGRPLFRRGREEDALALNQLTWRVEQRLVGREKLLRGTQGCLEITDDNMGTEWGRAR